MYPTTLVSEGLPETWERPGSPDRQEELDLVIELRQLVQQHITQPLTRRGEHGEGRGPISYLGNLARGEEIDKNSFL